MASKDNHEGREQGAAIQGPSLDAQLDDSQVAAARLTAYVLGELEADERAAVDRELAASEALRREIAGIRRSVELVTAGLATEPVVPLPRRECLPVAGQARHSPKRRLQRSLAVSGRGLPRTRYVLAASLLLVMIGAGGWSMVHVQQTHKNANVVARLEQVGGGAHQAETSVTDSEDETSGQARVFVQGRMGTDQDGRAVPYVVGGRNQSRGGQEGVAYTIMKPTYEAKTRGGRPFSLFGNTLDESDGFSRSETRAAASNTPSDAMPLEGMPNTESYDRIDENPFLEVRQNPLSTFSIDVDTASYANVRRFLNGGSLPPKDAVRIEEMLNYFTYHYAPPADDRPFAVNAEVAGCPWEPKHRLLRIALKGREIDLDNRPASNLVFLIDVSGSMDNPAKLPLLKSALHLLIDKLAENDRVAMVVYAGSSGLVLPSTSGLNKETIRAALDQLQAGGSTNGGSGIQLAYQVAREKFIRGGTNRVILCTDGDFNVGVTDQGSLTRLIEEEAKSGVFLSVLGFGAGNLKDSTMEKLADRGNGNYAYIDTPNEARKVLVEQLGGTLVTIAKDVKLQIEFNPRKLAAYRLIGYENRLLRAEDFNDDKKDAGEIGAGHTVTAVYELVPAGAEVSTSKVDELKYQRTGAHGEGAFNDELLTLKLRYKEPDGDKSKLIESVVKDAAESYARASEDFRFAAAVAGFGLLLRDSQYKGDLTWGAVLELAAASRGADESGYRTEFVELVKRATAISGR
jgi:Ca-activated chloride channel family protein